MPGVVSMGHSGGINNPNMMSMGNMGGPMGGMGGGGFNMGGGNMNNNINRGMGPGNMGGNMGGMGGGGMGGTPCILVSNLDAEVSGARHLKY